MSRKEWERQYYIKNKQRIDERNLNYYNANKEDRLAYQHAYNDANEIERKEKNKIRYWRNRDMPKATPTKIQNMPVPVSFSISFA